MVAGYLLKAQCLSPWLEGHQYGSLCYNDIQPLYLDRGLESGQFPYVDGAIDGTELSGGAIEYPVLTGVFMWFVATFVSHDMNAYLIATALALAPFGLLAAYWLARMTGWRALMWAAAPAVILYSFHNWDLLVVAATVGGFWRWRRGDSLGAAIAFGIGGCLKMYPLMFLAPLVLEQLQRRRIADAVWTGLGGTATFALVNAPFAYFNLEGWWATYQFHRLRVPNYDSIWFLKFPTWTPETVNLWSGALTVATLAAVLSIGWMKGRRSGEFPVLEVSAAMLAGFLLWNKVHSPQYTMWLLPFFVLLRVHYLWWALYSAIDILVYIGVFRFFYALIKQTVPAEPARVAMMYGVYGRAVLLFALIVVFIMSRRADDEPYEEAEEVLSHPPPKVTPVGEQAPA